MGATESTQTSANKTSRKSKRFQLYSSSMYLIPQNIEYVPEKQRLKTDTQIIACMFLLYSPFDHIHIFDRNLHTE